MSRKWFFQSFARSNAADRSPKSRRHLSVESLEGRNLLTTLSVNIADNGCATEGDHNYCQIQDAIDAAAEGDVIEVSSGTYDKIQIHTDNLTLRAAEGAIPTIDARSGLSAVGLHADGVTVHGFVVENALRGFDVSGDSNTLSANQAKSIGLFGDGFRAAFFLQGAESNTLSGNTAENVRHGFHLVDSDSNTLENNHVSTAGSMGFMLNGSDFNTLRQNTALNSGQNGFILWTDNHSNVLMENIAEGNGQTGIAVLSSSNNIIENNMARGNRWGIAVEADKWLVENPPQAESNILEGNTAKDNAEWGFGLGETDSNTLRGNVAEDNGGSGFVIFHSGLGKEFGDSESNMFQDNMAIGNGGFGFSIPEVDEALANEFENNRCVENASGAANLDVVECSLPKAGDANLDDEVNALDLNEIGLNWRQNVTGWRSGDFNADGRVDAIDLNALALNWRQDVAGEAAAARAPRAALANRVSVPIVSAQDTHGFIVASQPQSSLGDKTVISKTDYDLPSNFTRRYVRREPMASTRIKSRASDIQQSSEMNEEQPVRADGSTSRFFGELA